MSKSYIVKADDETQLIVEIGVNSTGAALIATNPVSFLTPYEEPDLEAIKQEAYQKGLNDAWDAAKKIVLSTEDGGLFDYDVRKAVLGCGNYMALKKYSASEAIEKIRQYEQEQEEIKVGDEVELKCGVRHAIYMQGTKGSDEIYLLFNDGSCGVHSKSEIERKTGRHFPGIVEIIKKMQEGK